MKIQTNNGTGEVTFHPVSEPAETLGFTIREVTEEIQTAFDSAGGELKWIPDDEEDPKGSGTLTRLPLTVPRSISAWQAKAALALTPHPEGGTMLAAAEEEINGMPDGPEKTVILAAWNHNANFERNSPTILSFGTTLEMSPADLDALFITAANLKV